MRSTQSASALLALFATAASALTPARLHCLRSRNVELSRLSTCGMAGSVAHCLDMIPDDFSQSDLEACYVNAGCEHAEAIIEAQWTLDKCDDFGNMEAELRIRHAPVFARATTTGDTTATAATTATGATSATATATSATGSGTTATGTATGASTLTCSTTTTISTTQCPVISTGAKAGKTIKSGCFPTQVAYATCAAGLLCQDDASGNPSCLVIDNSIGGGGIAVALFFAVAITGAITIITWLCCRERKEKKRIAARAEAAAIAKASAVGAKRPTANVQAVGSEPNVNQPLISNQQGPYDAPDPFGDRNRL